MFHVVTKEEYDEAQHAVLYELHELPAYPPQWPHPCFWWRGGIIPNVGQLTQLVAKLTTRVAHATKESE